MGESSIYITTPITGVLLCGGESKRMGIDKAFINYHGVPQYHHLYNLLKPLCDTVVISCNQQQFHLIPDTFTKVLDAQQYKDAGPMTGVLSTIHTNPGQSILVVGCDYPFIDETILNTLLHARDSDHDAVSIFNQTSGFYEPLISLYEERCFDGLMEFYANKNTSLQQFLKAIQTKKVITEELYKIQSIDTKNEFDRITSKGRPA